MTAQGFRLRATAAASSPRRAATVEECSWPDSWGKDNDDCCSWERVKCNGSTQRVSHLDLHFVRNTISAEDVGI
ncbi:hypothetical protein BRADI_5g23947v3 [Brachypodium distachyon]|uniref:Leucine-rich repeat-containing N-terminal plant-type domain-containing protein n=1 Tax=Brachypodium distachyon TaxID=15368 RepID=A0A0Q3IFH9_BRADI|nr:hypothetical protein BRADI_5g23947v3 [Brachypodium distachyon]